MSQGTRRTLSALTAALATFGIGAGPALAEGSTGMSRDWQIGFQAPVTPIMEELEFFHNGILLPLITAISLFVLLLLLFVIVRFNARANPVPSKNTHNTLVEVVWTLAPVIILIVIAIPSFKLLFNETRIPDPDLTIKVTGNAWNWRYEYPDHEGIEFTAVMTQTPDLKEGEPRLLTTNYKVVVPVNKNVHMLVTASDVIHAWAVPAFGVKIDAMPGRMNETWFRAEQEGIFYGQCSELCGKDHAFMPIEIHVVSEELFARWAEAAKQDVDEAGAILAEARSASNKVAAAAPARALQ